MNKRIPEYEIIKEIREIAAHILRSLDRELDYAMDNGFEDEEAILDGDLEYATIGCIAYIDMIADNPVIKEFLRNLSYNDKEIEIWASVPKEVVLGDHENDTSIDYTYKQIVADFGSYKVLENVNMGDLDEIKAFIFDAIFEHLKELGIFRELQESRLRKKYKRMIGESSEDRDPKSEKKEDILEAIESFSMLTCFFPIDDLSKQREIEKDENGNKVAVANTIAFTFLIENEKIQEHFRKKGTEEFRILFRSKIEQNGRASLAEEIFVNDKLIARSAQGYFGAKKAIYDYFVRILEKDKFFDSLKESKRKSFRGGGNAKKTLKESSSYVLKKSTIREDVNAMIDYCVKSFTEAFEDTDSYGYEYENEDGELEWDWDEFEYEHYLPQSHIGKDSEITFNYMEDAGLTHVNIHLQPKGNKAWVHLKLIDPERNYYSRILFRDNEEVTYSEIEKYIKDWLSEILFNKLEVVEQVVYFNEHDYDEVTESKKKLKRK